MQISKALIRYSILNTRFYICEFWLSRITASCDGRPFYNKNFQFKFYRSDQISHNTASCKGENWVNKEEKSQYWELCCVAAFTALYCLLHNLLYWAEKTVFIQSYPTKLWILTQKSFIEQNKMLGLSILTYLAPPLSYSIKWACFFIFKMEVRSEIFIWFLFVSSWRINISEEFCSVKTVQFPTPL